MRTLEMMVLADSWGWHHDDVGTGWWFVMMLGMVVFWGAAIAFVVWLLRGGLERRGKTPEETLRRQSPARRRRRVSGFRRRSRAGDQHARTRGG